VSLPIPAPPAEGIGSARHRSIAVIIVLLTGLATGGVALATRPVPVLHLTRGEAAEAGMTVDLVRHVLAGGAVVEIRADGSSHPKLLAVAPDGSSALLAEPFGIDPSTLVVVREDGSQIRLEMPGLLAAAYGDHGDRLAAIDGTGGLWEVNPGTGESRRLADGPFAGPPIVGDDGSVIALLVSSVEAPFVSRLVSIDARGRVSPFLSDAELVYAAFPLASGDLAISVHASGGTEVRRIGAGRDELMADLGPGATDVSVARDGRIAFTADHGAVFVIDRPGGEPRALVPGAHPVFGQDGDLLTVTQGDETVVVAIDGTELERLAGDASLVACGAECGS